jgi:hypothetical protein
MTYRVRTDLDGFVPRAGQVGEVVDLDLRLVDFPIMLRFADGETRSYREREVERVGDEAPGTTEAPR